MCPVSSCRHLYLMRSDFKMIVTKEEIEDPKVM